MSQRAQDAPPREMTSKREGPAAILAVAVTVILGISLVFLESGLDEKVVPSYIGSDEFDVAAYNQMFATNPDFCDGVGSQSIEGQIECVAFDDHGGPAYSVVMAIIAGGGAALVIFRKNPLGWLIVAGVLADLLAANATAYAFKGAVFDPGSLPAPVFAATIGGTLWVLTLVIVIPRILLTLPSGRLLSDRWRWVVRLTYLVAASLAFVALSHPLILGAIPNPLALPWSVSTADGIGGILINGMLLCWALGALSLAIRLFRSIRTRLTANA